MPLTSADNPAADQPVVAPVTEPAAVGPGAGPGPGRGAAQAQAGPGPPVRAPAVPSGPAQVHNLIAEWQIASSNQDKAHLAAVDEKLAALGYQI